jgi:hypothetical protein
MLGTCRAMRLQELLPLSKASTFAGIVLFGAARQIRDGLAMKALEAERTSLNLFSIETGYVCGQEQR